MSLRRSPASGGHGGASPWYLHGGSVGFREAVRQAFRHGFIYRGRASRSAYWWFALFQAAFFLAFTIFVIVAVAATGGPARVHGSAIGVTIGVVLIIAYLFAAYLILVSVALLVRRLHDLDKPGWWAFLVAVPSGGLGLLIFALLRGTDGPNRYDQL